MKLTISYKNCEQRIVNLHPTFFTSDVDVAFNHKNNRLEKRILTPSDKAMVLSGSFGTHPHTILLERNGSIQLNKIIRENAPAAKVMVEKINEKKVKKDLKKECKGQILHTLTHVSF